MITVKLNGNQKENFINFWEFLEIPMNSPIRDIKIAFISKFEKIENSINKGESKYSLEDLKICISAYETLSNPYSRLLHNCEIDGEEPPRASDWDSYFSDDGISDDDLSEESSQKFLAWLLTKAKKLTTKMELFMVITNRLYELFIKENEKQEKKEQHHRNKKTMRN